MKKNIGDYAWLLNFDIYIEVGLIDYYKKCCKNVQVNKALCRFDTYKKTCATLSWIS